MASSSGEEEEEFEYEEVEVEVEEEVDDDEFEEDEVVEEEVVVEEEEPVEEEEEEPMEEEEEEPMEEEEEEEEVVVEEDERVKGDEEQGEEEEEEEEYEEIEEEVEVTDDEEMEEAAAAEEEVEEEVVAVAVAVKNESAVGSSDSPVPVADHPLHDSSQDGQTKANEVCSSSRIQDTVNSEVAAPLNDHAVEASGSMLRSMSPTPQKSKGKEACKDTVTYEVATPLVVQAVEAISGSTLGSPPPGKQNRKGKEVLTVNDRSIKKKFDANSSKLRGDKIESEQGVVQRSPLVAPVKDTFSVVDGSFNLQARLKSEANPPKLKVDTVEHKHDLVGTTPLVADRERVEQNHIEHIAPTLTSEKRVSGPNDIYDRPSKIESNDIDETRVPSQKEDLQLPSSGNMDPESFRYFTPQVRLRSSSPQAESEAVSKRSAIVCEYFAKGWCIKGSTCRFLHKRDQVDFGKGQVEGVLQSTNSIIAPGSEDAAGGSESFAHSQPKFLMGESDDMLPVSAGGRYTENDHRERVNDKDNFRVLERDTLYPRLSISSQRSPLSKEGCKVLSEQNEAEVDTFKGSCSSDRLERHGSSASFGRSTLLDNFASGNQTNHSSLSYAVVEESVALRRQYTLELHSSPISGFSAKLSSTFGNAPLLDNSSVKELLDSYKSKRKFTPYDWEPSVPFRPSHFIPSFTRSTSNAPYDPLRDSMDQPYVRHGSLRNSSGGQKKGAVHQHTQSISVRKSGESNKMLHSDSNYKDYYTHDKDARVVEAESAAISATNAENKNTSDEILGIAASVKDVLKASRSISDGNSQLNVDDLRRRGEIGRQTNELDEEESRAIKIFRAALIEFVKELMKPVWHEGRLSKDVYKVIVQKAEDKILSTLPSTEVPNTPESIKQYLSSSRPNILKLIQAYVDKYGKF